MPNREYYVDEQEGMGRVLNNVALYVKMLKSFASKPYLANLKTALAEGDMQTAVLTAHSIKGVAANLSFPAIYEVMKTVEGELKEGKTEGFDWDTIDSCMEKTLIYISEIIKEKE